MTPPLLRHLARGTIAGLTLACVSCGNGRGHAEDVRFERVEDVTYTGCVVADDRVPPRLRLWTFDGDEPRDIGVGGTRLRQSTTVNGPWLGTRQLELVGDQMAPLRRLADHRVRVTGVLDAQAGQPGSSTRCKMRTARSFVSCASRDSKCSKGPAWSIDMVDDETDKTLAR
jgi:hypothetical protein